MKAEIGIHVDNYADRRSQVTITVEIFRGEEYPATYEEIHAFYISEDDSPLEIFKALNKAKLDVSYWEE